MPNVRAPFGFAVSHRLGAAPNYQISRRFINPANPTPIYKGDPVSVVPSAGYIQQATPSTTQIAGIFLGCDYYSVSQQKWVSSPMWPGGDAAPGVGVAARIIDDPMMVFRVQANGGPVTLAMLGMNAQFDIATVAGGSVVPKISGAMLDTITSPPAVTATFPFRIVDLITDPPGSNGADTTTPYNIVFVTFNNQDYKVQSGI